MKRTLVEIRDRAVYDWHWSRRSIGHAVYASFRAALTLNRPKRAFRLGSTLLSSNMLPSVDAAVIREFRAGMDGWVAAYLDEYLRGTLEPRRFSEHPERLLGQMLLVSKSWAPGEKGLIVLRYSYTFPILMKRFDVARLAERYRVYVEPSWSGVICEDVLTLARFPGDVFCAAFEPRDHRLLCDLKSNIKPIANMGPAYFVSDEFLKSGVEASPRYDLITVSRWAQYKCYGSLLRCLSRLKLTMPKLRVACVGYPGDHPLVEIRQIAARLGLKDNVDFFEKLPTDQVRELLGASRLNVLWSRREGAPKTPFEGFLAGTPLLLRQGFNYGHCYDFVKAGIARFADERDFAAVAVDMLAHRGPDPRVWMQKEMTATVSTERLQRVIREVAESQGEIWTRNLAVRYTTLDTQRYQDESLRPTFQQDYDFIRGCIIN